MRKDAQICLRLTKLQKEKILAKASQINMNITDYMVNAGIKRKITITITITNIPDLYDIKIELKRIGNNLNQLTRLCNESNLKTIPIHKKYRDIKNNEYQVMLKGKSWKGRLISAIDFSLSNTNSKEEFILYMNQFGYDVNWQNTRKYITYTTPEGMKCRDNKLHEEKYLKEKMEDFYGIKRNESITNSSANEYENGRTIQKANIFRRTNTEIKKIEKSMDSTMESIKKYTKELSAKMYKIEIMETDITNLIKETQELPKKLRIQVKLKYMAIGMIVSAIISILIIILK